MTVIYVDNNATTRVAPEVLEAMLPYFSEYYGNPSSMHSFGGNVSGAIKTARENIADLIGALSTEVALSASIGISLYPENGTTAEELIRSADKAMYQIKRQGKNDFGFVKAAIR